MENKLTPHLLTSNSQLPASVVPICLSAASLPTPCQKGFKMLRETSKAWSNGSEAYSSDPEEDDEEEEDMVFGESEHDGMAEEMMDLSDLPTALFACSVHDAVFEQDVHRVSCRKHFLGHILSCVCAFV